MTPDDSLKLTIGDLVVKVAFLSARVEELEKEKAARMNEEEPRPIRAVHLEETG